MSASIRSTPHLMPLSPDDAGDEDEEEEAGKALDVDEEEGEVHVE